MPRNDGAICGGVQDDETARAGPGGVPGIPAACCTWVHRHARAARRKDKGREKGEKKKGEREKGKREKKRRRKGKKERGEKEKEAAAGFAAAVGHARTAVSGRTATQVERGEEGDGTVIGTGVGTEIRFLVSGRQIAGKDSSSAMKIF